MKKSKKKIIIITSILLFILFIIIVVALLYKNNSENNDGYKKIQKLINNKEEFFIYVSSNNKCNQCRVVQNIVDEHSKKYKFKYEVYNTSEHSKEDYKNLIKTINMQVDPQPIPIPYLVYFKNGIKMASIVSLSEEKQIKEFLYQTKFVSDEEMKKNTQIGIDEFNKMLKSKEQNLIIVPYNSEDIDLIKQLDNKYNFNYYYIYSETVEMDLVREKINKSVKGPNLIITQNNTVKIFNEDFTEKKVTEFLEENNYISKI